MSPPSKKSEVIYLGHPATMEAKVPSKAEIEQKEKEARKKIPSQGNSASTATAVLFGTLEGKGILKSHRMRLPGWEQFNKGSFTTNELEIFGALDNSKEIILPATKLIMDMQGADLKNTRRIACRELFVKNCGICDNKGTIETHGNLKIEVRQILNVANPVVTQEYETYERFETAWFHAIEQPDARKERWRYAGQNFDYYSRC